MKQQAYAPQGSADSKGSSFVQHLLVPLVVGLVVLAGQCIVAPIVAKGVKTQESILEQKYNACENAVNILQRYLAAVPITGRRVPEWYVPAETTKPSQIEVNVAYTLLKIYGDDDTVSDQFRKAISGPGTESVTGNETIDPADIVKFVSAVRKELGVGKQDSDSQHFSYIFLHRADVNEQEHSAPRDEPN